MPSIFNAQLTELGTVYMVNNVIMSEAKYVLPSAKYVDLPNETALKLKNDLNQGKVITIIDEPLSKDIPYDHFKVEVAKTLNQKKSTARAKVYQRIHAYTALLTGYDILEFWMIVGKLQSYGYDIMNEANKEEVYLSIINSGNEDHITDLERFLEVKEVFDNMMKKYRDLKRYLRDINDCDTEQELAEVIQSNHGWMVN